MTETGTRNYVAILDKILKSYNSRPHRMLGNKTPEFAEKNPTNAYIATKNQEYLDSKKSKKGPRIPKYKIGMRVRVKRLGDAFHRGYGKYNFNILVKSLSIFLKNHFMFLLDGSFNEEVYKIVGVKTRLDVPLFKLETLDGQTELAGYYYSHELSRARGEILYRIESVLATRGARSLVKWVGFKQPTWIPTRDIQNLG